MVRTGVHSGPKGGRRLETRDSGAGSMDIADALYVLRPRPIGPTGQYLAYHRFHAEEKMEQEPLGIGVAIRYHVDEEGNTTEKGVRLTFPEIGDIELTPEKWQGLVAAVFDERAENAVTLGCPGPSR